MREGIRVTPALSAARLPLHAMFSPSGTTKTLLSRFFPLFRGYKTSRPALFLIELLVYSLLLPTISFAQPDNASKDEEAGTSLSPSEPQEGAATPHNDAAPDEAAGISPDMQVEALPEHRPVPSTVATMHQLAQDVSKLLPLLAARERFMAGAERDLVIRSLGSLRSHLQSLAASATPSDTIPSSRRGATTSEEASMARGAVAVDGQEEASAKIFQAKSSLLLNIIEGAEKQYSKENRDYAWWRLRFVTRACFQCHATGTPTTSFHMAGELPASSGLLPQQQADFYLATRQPEKAQIALDNALTAQLDPFETLSLLRRWLALAIQESFPPAQIRRKLLTWSEKANLFAYDRKLVRSWMSDLEKWDKAQGQPTTFDEAKALIATEGQKFSGPTDKNEVFLLRAANIVAQQLGEAPDTTRRAELYLLLGIAYSKLPLLFSDEIPEAYLREAITTAPHSEIAERAWHNLRSYLFRVYSGSGGNFLPEELSRDLKALEKLAAQPRPPLPAHQESPAAAK